MYGRTVERFNWRAAVLDVSLKRGSSSAATAAENSQRDAGDYVDNPVYHSAAPFTSDTPQQSQSQHTLPSLPQLPWSANYGKIQEERLKSFPTWHLHQTSSNHITLPEPSIDSREAPWLQEHLTLRKMVQRRTVADNIALVDACLSAQAIKRAHHIITDVMAAIDGVAAVQIYNNYLSGLVNVLRLGHVTWDVFIDRFRAMRREFGVVPDVRSYAILCKGALVAHTDEVERETVVQQYANEYVRSGDIHRALHDLLLPKTVFQDEQISGLMAALGLTLGNIPADKRLLLEDIVMDDHLRPKSKLAEFSELVSVDTRNISHLKRSLQTLNGVEDLASLHDPKLHLSYEMQRQAKLERDTMQSAVDKWKEAQEEVRARGEPNLGGLRKVLWQWHESMVESLQEDLKLVKGEPKRDVSLMLMRLLPIERLSSVTILEVMRLNSSGGIAMGMKIARACSVVGQAIEQEYIAQQLASKDSMALFGKYQRMQDVFQSGRQFSLALRRVQAAELAQAEADTAPILAARWTNHCHIQIGSRLIMHLIKVAKIESRAVDTETGEILSQVAPAFYQSFQFLKGKRYGVIRLNNSLVQKLLSEPIEGSLPTKASPMLVPPKPWVSPESGGYFFTSEEFMRTNHSQEQLAHLMEAHRKRGLELLFRGLDALGLTCWRINERIYRIMAEIWNSGAGIGKIPASSLSDEPPQKPADLNDVDALSLWRKQMKWYTQNYQSLFSMRCTANYKLEIARSVGVSFLNTIANFLVPRREALLSS